MDTSKYFYRNITFSKTGSEVFMVDLLNPEGPKEKLDGWFGLVMLMADGQHTVDELFQFLSTKYEGAAPPNLSDTINSVVERMAEMKLVVLTDIATELPYYLTLPMEQLDLEKAKEELTKDRQNMN